MVQGLLDSPVRIALTALGLLSLVTLAAVAMLGSREQALKAVERQMSDLIRQSGMRVELQHIDKIRKFTNLEADPLTQLLVGARKSIHVLDFISRDGEWPDSGVNREHMRKHHEAVLRHVRQSMPSIAYRRICQVEVNEAGRGDGPTVKPFASAGRTEALDHYLAMLRLRQELDDPTMVSIRVAAQRYPYKFIIVDGRSLVLSLQHFDRHRNLQLLGELIVLDAKADFLEVFMQMWRDLENRSVPFDEPEELLELTVNTHPVGRQGTP
ncbi:hypothetical protein [Microbispora corallina]|nr:hypothetical protein [Microbispora corallina]